MEYGKPRLVSRLLKQLPIQWKVIIEPGKGDVLLIKSEFIDVEKRKGIHRIFAPPSYLANPEYYRVDWAHELCHALLAEKIDLIFAGFPVLGEIDLKERERRAEILFYASLHQDLLVNDARDELLGGQFTLGDLYSTHQSFLKMVEHLQKSQETIKTFLDLGFPGS